MATSNLVQSLNPGTSFPSNRRQIETFLKSSTIVEGDLVALDLSKTNSADQMLYIVPANSGASNTGLAVGIYGDKVDVVISGFASCKVGGATAAGANLDASVAAGIATTVTHEGIAYAITGHAAGKANVFVKSRF
jgi:predicted phage tail protein